MNKYGPSLHDELSEAGLDGLPFCVQMGTGWVNDVDLTPEQKEKLQTVLKNHNPNKKSKRQLIKEENQPFIDWLSTASSDDIDEWVDNQDPKFVLKTLIKFFR